MDRGDRKREIRAYIDAIRLPGTEDAVTYGNILARLGAAEDREKAVVRSALADCVFDCRRRGADETPYALFLNWLYR